MFIMCLAVSCKSVSFKDFVNSRTVIMLCDENAKLSLDGQSVVTRMYKELAKTIKLTE